jgi:hypothetical protein
LEELTKTDKVLSKIEADEAILEEKIDDKR